MSASGGLARRLWGTASTNGMPATSCRDQTLPNNLAPHRTLRRTIAPVLAKMPRRLGPLSLTDLKTGSAGTANAPTPPMSASGAPRSQMKCPQRRRHSPPISMSPHRTLQRAMALVSAKMPRRGLSVNLGLSVRELSNLYDNVRQRVARAKANKTTWPNHRLRSNRSDPNPSL
jgi:hypothetical protein